MELQGKVKITAALDALARQGVDIGRATLIEWCRKHGLGIQLGPKGHWMVDIAKLHKFVTEGTYSKQEGGAKMK